MTSIPARHFAFFRIALGLYLALHFAQLLPYGAELFSNQGMLPQARLNLTFGILPNPLAVWDSPSSITLFLSALLLLSLAFAAGLQRRMAALLLWFGWACLFNRNNLILNPSLPYIGALLLLSTLLPLGESWRRGQSEPGWRFPASVAWAAWLLLAAGYTYSGWMKLLSPSWLDGTALFHVLQNPLARPGIFRDALLHLPPSWLQIATWVSLAGELLFLPLSFRLTTRLVAWLTMFILQIVILGVVNFADLTIAMLLFHCFVFDPRWFAILLRRKTAGRLRPRQAEMGPRVARKLESA
ncbi:MAG: hypothetical protein ABIU29_11920 [Chthoniobacterales bacterium]